MDEQSMDGHVMGRSYTKGRRQPFLIRKWPGSQWALPFGPYTMLQLVLFIVSGLLLVKFWWLWAHFGPLNYLLVVGIPITLGFVSRHSRIEGRDPIKFGLAAGAYLLQSRSGYVGGQPWRKPPTVDTGKGEFTFRELPADLVEPTPIVAVSAINGPRHVEPAPAALAPWPPPRSAPYVPPTPPAPATATQVPATPEPARNERAATVEFDMPATGWGPPPMEFVEVPQPVLPAAQLPAAPVVSPTEYFSNVPEPAPASLAELLAASSQRR